MQSLQMALSVSVPLIVYMAVGIMIRKVGLFTSEGFSDFNKVIFKVLIPVLLFMNIYKADLKKAIQPGVFLFVFIGVVAAMFFSMILAGAVTKDKKDIATITHACYRTNFVLFGSIVASALCDADGVALVAALSALTIPLFNILAIVLFESAQSSKISVKHILLEIIKNTLVQAGVLGVIFAGFGIHIPSVIATPLEGITNAATPIALITLGGLLNFGSIQAHRKLLTFATVIRLIIIPIIAISIATLLFGYRGNELAAVLAVFAGPTAVTSAPMAQMMGGNGPLAGEIVASTSVFCSITLFIYVFFLSAIGWL